MSDTITPQARKFLNNAVQLFLDLDIPVMPTPDHIDGDPGGLYVRTTTTIPDHMPDTIVQELMWTMGFVFPWAVVFQPDEHTLSLTVSCYGDQSDGNEEIMATALVLPWLLFHLLLVESLSVRLADPGRLIALGLAETVMGGNRSLAVASRL